MTSSMSVSEKKKNKKSKYSANSQQSSKSNASDVSQPKKNCEKSKSVKNQIKEWEAARRKRFNQMLDALRLELPNSEPCPKIEIVQRALAFVKDHKYSNSMNGTCEKLEKQNALLSQVIKDAGILIQVNNKREVSYHIPEVCDKNCHHRKKRKVMNLLSALNTEDAIEKNCVQECTLLDKEVQTEEGYGAYSHINMFSVGTKSSSVLLECNRLSTGSLDTINSAAYQNATPSVVDSLNRSLSPVSYSEDALKTTPFGGSHSKETISRELPKEHIIVNGEERNGSITVSILSDVQESNDPCFDVADPKHTSGNAPPLIMHNLSGQLPSVLPIVRVSKQSVHIPSVNFETKGSPTVLVQDLKTLNVLPKASENSPTKLLKAPGNNSKMILVKCQGAPAKLICKAPANFLVSQLPEAHVTIVTPSLSNAPIMSTGLATVIGQKKAIIQANPNIPLLLNASYANTPTTRLKRIAPKPAKEPDSSVSKPIEVSAKKQTALKIMPRLQYKRKKSEEDIFIPQVNRTPSKEPLVLNGPLEPSLQSSLKTSLPDNMDDLKEISANSLSEHVQNSGMTDSDGELENMMDLPVDMPCVIPETIRGSEVTEDKLVEMLRSMDEEDRQCSFSLSSESMPKLYKKSDLTKKVPPHTTSEIEVKLQNKETQVDCKVGKSRELPANLHAVTDVSVWSSNYSIMSLCISSKAGDEINSSNKEINTATSDIDHLSSNNANSCVNKADSVLPDTTYISNSSNSSSVIVSHTKSEDLSSHSFPKPSSFSTSCSSEGLGTINSVEHFSASSLKSDLSVPLISLPVIQTESFGPKCHDAPPLLDLPTTSVPPALVPPSIFLPPHPFSTPQIPPIALPSLTLPCLPSTRHSSIYSYPLSSNSTSSVTASLTLSQSKCAKTTASVSSSNVCSESINSTKPFSKFETNSKMFVPCEKTEAVEPHPTSDSSRLPKASKLLYSCPVSTTQSLKMPFSLPAVPSPLPILSTIPSSVDASNITKPIFSLTPISSYAHPFPFCALSLSDAPTTFSFTLTRTSSSTSGSASVGNETTYAPNISENYKDDDVTCKATNMICPSTKENISVPLKSDLSLSCPPSYSALSQINSFTNSLPVNSKISSLTTSNFLSAPIDTVAGSSSMITSSSTKHITSAFRSASENQHASEATSMMTTTNALSCKLDSDFNKQVSVTCYEDYLPTKSSAIASAFDFSTLSSETSGLKTFFSKDIQKQKTESHDFKLPLLPLSTYLDTLGSKEHDLKSSSNFLTFSGDARIDGRNMSCAEAASFPSKSEPPISVLNRTEATNSDQSSFTITDNCASKKSSGSCSDSHLSTLKDASVTCSFNESKLNAKYEQVDSNNSKTSNTDKLSKEALVSSICGISQIIEDDRNSKEKSSSLEPPKDSTRTAHAIFKPSDKGQLLQETPLDFRASSTEQKEAINQENLVVAARSLSQPSFVENSTSKDGWSKANVTSSAANINGVSHSNTAEATLSQDKIICHNFSLETSAKEMKEYSNAKKAQNTDKSTTQWTSTADISVVSLASHQTSLDSNFDGNLDKKCYKMSDIPRRNYKNVNIDDCKTLTARPENSKDQDNALGDAYKRIDQNQSYVSSSIQTNKCLEVSDTILTDNSISHQREQNSTTEISAAEELRSKSSASLCQRINDNKTIENKIQSFQAIHTQPKTSSDDAKLKGKSENITSVDVGATKEINLKKVCQASRNELNLMSVSSKVTPDSCASNNQAEQTPISQIFHKKDSSSSQLHEDGKSTMSQVQKPNEAIQKQHSKEQEHHRIQQAYQANQPPSHQQISYQSNVKQCQGQAAFVSNLQKPLSGNQMQQHQHFQQLQLHSHQTQQQQQQYPLLVNQQLIKSNDASHQLGGVQNITHKEAVPQSTHQQRLQHVQQHMHHHQHSKPPQHQQQQQQQIQHQHQQLQHHQSQPHSNQQLNQAQSLQIAQGNPQQHLQAMNTFGGAPLVDTGNDRGNIKGQQQHSVQLHHSPMGSSAPYAQSFDYNPYCRKVPQSPRSETRHQCHDYNKHIAQYQSELLSDHGVTPGHPLIQPSFLDAGEDVSMRGIEDSPTDHVRYFSVSRLVSPCSEGRKSDLNPKDQHSPAINEEKVKEPTNKVKNSRKGETKTRNGGSNNGAKGTSQLGEPKRSPARSGGGSHSNNSNGLWNSKNSSAQKQGHNYSAEALISSQNCVRSSHRQGVNQNYHFMSPNQVYQSSYSSQPVKNFAQNPSFGYSGHERSGICNSDYNFQLHTQSSGPLPYGHNMPYMTPAYPYQNLPPTSSAMIHGDIMTPHHPGAYPRLHDFNPEHSNFASNTTFPLPLDPQDMCGGPGIMNPSNMSSMGVRSSEAPLGILSSSAIHSRSGLAKSSTNGIIVSSNSINSGVKRSRYGDSNMGGPSMGTPTNFLDGGAFSHISLHSFTPPCDDSSFMHSNFLTGSSRHQSNFLLGSDNFMPINTSQHSVEGALSNVEGHVSGISSSSSNNSMGINGNSNLGGMTAVSSTRSAPPVLPPHASLGQAPFNPSRMVDRQQMNIAPPVGPHLSSSLANFNLTSIIPEIDGKNDEASSAGINSSTSQPLSVTIANVNISGSSVSASGQSRLHPMNTSSLVPSNDAMKAPPTSASHPDAVNRIPSPTLNSSMSNIFPHSHQVSLGLNASLPLQASSFPGINFVPVDH